MASGRFPNLAWVPEFLADPGTRAIHSPDPVNLFLNFAFSGLILGCVYALLAVGFGLIFQTTGIFHIAHAMVYTTAGYVGYTAATSVTANFLFATLVATVFAVVLGGAMYVCVYSFLIRRGGSLMVTFIAALGMTIMIQAVLGMTYGLTPRRMPFVNVTETHSYFGIRMSKLDWAIAATTVVLVVLVLGMMSRTNMGRMIRAVGVDSNLAQAYGLPVKRIFLIVFLIGSALAGTAAMFGATQGFLVPTFGIRAVLVASIAVFVGGVGNLLGAAIAALLIGFVQNVSLLVVSGSWQSSVTFGLFLIIVLLRPQGLLAGGVSAASIRATLRASGKRNKPAVARIEVEPPKSRVVNGES